MASETNHAMGALQSSRRSRTADGDPHVLREKPSINTVQVAKLLSRTDERLVATERELIEAVRRTIQVTEGMIALVRSTTATTHSLMAPLRSSAGHGAGCVGCSNNAHCGCQRVTMAKDLVRVVEGLNHTAGQLNEATDFMIKLSNSLSPREELAGACVDFLASKVEAAGRAIGSIEEVQSALEQRARDLSSAADDLEGLKTWKEETGPERDQAVADLRAMKESAAKAVEELSGTVNTLKCSMQFLDVVLVELRGLQDVQECPEAGATLLDQLECPVCYQSSAPPALWTCDNGHVVCASCRVSLLTCPTCRGSLCSRPAALLTAWASSLRAWCPYRDRGCDSLLTLTDRAKHHEACSHRGDQVVRPNAKPDDTVEAAIPAEAPSSPPPAALADTPLPPPAASEEAPSPVPSASPPESDPAILGEDTDVAVLVALVREPTDDPSVPTSTALVDVHSVASNAATVATVDVEESGARPPERVRAREWERDADQDALTDPRRKRLRTRWKTSACCVM